MKMIAHIDTDSGNTARIIDVELDDDSGHGIVDIAALNAAVADADPVMLELDEEFKIADEDDEVPVAAQEPRIRDRVIIRTIPAALCAELVVEWLFSQFSVKVQNRESTAVRFFSLSWLEQVIILLGGAVAERDTILSLIQEKSAHRAGFFKHPQRADVVGIAPFREIGSEDTDKMFLTALPDADSKKVGFYVPGSQQRVLQAMADAVGVSVSDYLSNNVATGVQLSELARAKGVTVEELLAQLKS